MSYRDLRPDHTRRVEVLIDGQWHDGELEAYRREGPRWLGWVRWSLAPGRQHIGWYGEDSLRRGRSHDAPPEVVSSAGGLA